MTSTASPIVMIGIVATIAGCSQPQSQPVCAGFGANPMMEYRLFFGRNIAGRQAVADQEWAAFAEQVVTPHLPDGFTVLDANGQWMNPETRRISKERTKVIVVALPDTPAAVSAVAAVRDAYRIRFHQQSVGMTVQPVCGAF